MERWQRRWRARPGGGRALRAVLVVAPLAAGLLAGGLIAWWLGPRLHPVSAGVLATGAALGTAAVVTNGGRRLLPLAWLLELSLLFPARAPSRVRLARRAAFLRPMHLRPPGGGHGDAEAEQAAAEHVLALLAALQRHDRRTRGHAERVRVYTDLLSAELRLPLPDQDRLRWAALLHDIGKLAVPGEVLNKDRALDANEWIEVRRHPERGAALCGPLLKWLGPWGDAIAQHHERWDGTGYPHGLAGEQISLGARIVAVADAYEVMTAHRPYRLAVSAARARADLAAAAGSQFDPAIVRAFLNVNISTARWLIVPPLRALRAPVPARVPPRLRQAALASVALAAMAIGGLGRAPLDATMVEGLVLDRGGNGVLALAPPTLHRESRGGDVNPRSAPTVRLPGDVAPAAPDGAAAVAPEPPGERVASATAPPPAPTARPTAPAPAVGPPPQLPRPPVERPEATPAAPAAHPSSSAAPPPSPSPAPSPASSDEAAPPGTADDGTVTMAGRGVVIDVLANDPAYRSHEDARVTVGEPSAGRAVVTRTQAVRFIPPAGFTGVARVPYRACRPPGGCEDAWLLVWVLNPRTPLYARDDVVTLTPGSAGTVDVLGNDAGAFVPETVQIVQQPAAGSAEVADGAVVWRPSADAAGLDALRYEACDAEGRCAVATVRARLTGPVLSG